MGTRYEKSLFYQINSCSRYFEILFDQYFKELNFGITAKEHLVLCVISDTKDCCQRDLAKIILKDRANTGKLALKLQEKGLIKIELKSKNNKPVKILTATKKGKELCEEIIEKMKPMGKEIKEQITEEKIEKMINGLIEFRQVVQKTVKTNI